MSFADEVRVTFRRGDSAGVLRLAEAEVERARLAGDYRTARERYLASIELNEELGQPELVNAEYHNLASGPPPSGRGRCRPSARHSCSPNAPRRYWSSFVSKSRYATRTAGARLWTVEELWCRT